MRVYYPAPNGSGHWRLSPHGWWREEDVMRYVGPIRLHLPRYNRAAWEIEGKDLYPEFTWETYPSKMEDNK